MLSEIPRTSWWSFVCGTSSPFAGLLTTICFVNALLSLLYSTWLPFSSEPLRKPSSGGKCENYFKLIRNNAMRVSSSSSTHPLWLKSNILNIAAPLCDLFPYRNCPKIVLLLRIC